MKQNLHTHTLYCDGKDSVEEMVRAAIDKGFTTLGFSGHGNCRRIDQYSMDDQNTERYIRDVQQAKAKYRDRIQLFLGIEQDVLGKRFVKHQPYDYIIGSVHFVTCGDSYLAVDESSEITAQIVRHYGSFLSYARAYFEEVKKIAAMDEVDIVGHVDLLTKFNEDESWIAFDDPDYLQLACDCIDVLIKSGKIFEVNTGAIARGYRKTPYPHALLLSYIAKQGGKICLNSDCHNKDMLDCCYREALKLIKDCGFEEMMVLDQEKGFIPMPLAAFAA